VTTLSNGIRVASQYTPSLVNTVGVWIAAGSRYESLPENGVAHFLEHTLFKGTSSRTRTEFEKHCEDNGIHINAYTSREHIAYWAQTQPGKTKNGLELVADILLNAKLSEVAVNNEKGVILQEMQSIENMHDEVCLDYLHHAAFPEQALGRTILGPEENIKNITSEDLKTYMKKHYTTNRMLIVGAGSINHDDLVKWSESLFSTVPKATKPVIMEPAKFVGADYRHRIDSWGKAHMAFAFPCGGHISDDFYEMNVISEMLGGDKNLRKPYSQFSVIPMIADGYAQHTPDNLLSFALYYKDVSLVGVYTVADPYGGLNAAKLVADKMQALTQGVDKFHLEAAKYSLLRQAFSKAVPTHALADEIGRHILDYGRRIEREEVVEKVLAITPEDIRKAADTHFYDKDYALSAFGAIYELPDYNELRWRSY